MVVINDNYRFESGCKIREGGMARNEAIIGWLKTNADTYTEISLKKNRIINCLMVLKFLFSVKGESILFFYPTVGVPLHKNSFLGRVLSATFLKCLRRTVDRNEVYADICDLKYEQAIDLQIDHERWDCIKLFEEKFFSLNLKFLFASTSMCEYAIDKYHIEKKNCSVLVNGGITSGKSTLVSVCDKPEVVNIVYAGSLNRGRNIEVMINIVKGCSNVKLYLLGIGGSWIHSADNIVYLGEYEQAEAFTIVQKCDLGLIPYDEERKYYNIAYPTKLSFYLCAGIPYLSTDVSEVRKIFEKENIGYIEPINNWSVFLHDITKDSLIAEKEKIYSIKESYTWEKICDENNFLKIFRGEHT